MIHPNADVHFVVVYAVLGFSPLPTPTVELLSEKNASVWLTVDSDELFIHLDRMKALEKLIVRDGLDAFEERFASIIAEVRYQRKLLSRSRAWLVADTFLPTCRGQETLRELPEFAVSRDFVSDQTREDLEQLAHSALSRVIAGLSIILDESKFPEIKREGSANYSLRRRHGRPTYEFWVEMGSMTLSISSPPDERLIAALTDCIGRLPAVGVETALRLHKVALDERGDHLRSFVAAWAALEIFTNKVFAATFSPTVLSSLGLAVDGWEGELRARLTRKKKQEPELQDRFAFLAVWLSRSSAKADIDQFAKIKCARNGLYHRGDTRRLPTRDAIHLFRRYLALRVARQP